MFVLRAMFGNKSAPRLERSAPVDSLEVMAARLEAEELERREALDRQLADEVWFVPSPDRWDKHLFANAEHRLAMLRLVLAGESRFVVDMQQMQAAVNAGRMATPRRRRP